ncbi:hypothetical protein Tco_1083850 [Tanacetum coccineum]
MDYWMEISSDRDLLGPTPSYVHIQDPVRRLCHRMISYTISGRRQVPEKVTGVDLFYLQTMDHGTANVPYLLARYLFHFSEERKGVLDCLLPVIDLYELGRLNICTRYSNTWAWVAPRPERQQAAAAGAPVADEAGEAAKDAPKIPAPALAPAQAPAPPLVPQPRTIVQRIDRLEEEVHGLRHDIKGLRDDDARLTTDQTRVSTWLVSSMT